ncbi:hypothetical protein Mapa_005081 [Marchantia paleacea]|nr:hypothetical protein Mapa_005081 [Marchantia paleacea]
MCWKLCVQCSTSASSISTRDHHRSTTQLLTACCFVDSSEESKKPIRDRAVDILSSEHLHLHCA